MKNKDMFGNPIKKRKGKEDIKLSNIDRDTFDERLERLKYLNKIAPKGYSMFGSFETIAIFHEAQSAFINGEYIAAITLAQAFIERRLQGYMEAKGLEKEARRGLKSILKFYRDNHLINDLLVDKIDQLRQKRNPFSHLKPIDHPYTIGQRIAQELKYPGEFLEIDAKEALGLMYTIFKLKLFKQK
jgi:hypothetical protein